MKVYPSELLLIDMRKGDFYKKWEMRFLGAKSDFGSDFSGDIYSDLQMVAEDPAEFIINKKNTQADDDSTPGNNLIIKELESKVNKLEAVINSRKGPKKKK